MNQREVYLWLEQKIQNDRQDTAHLLVRVCRTSDCFDNRRLRRYKWRKNIVSELFPTRHIIGAFLFVICLFQCRSIALLKRTNPSINILSEEKSTIGIFRIFFILFYIIDSKSMLFFWNHWQCKWFLNIPFTYGSTRFLRFLEAGTATVDHVGVHFCAVSFDVKIMYPQKKLFWRTKLIIQFDFYVYIKVYLASNFYVYLKKGLFL